MWSHEQRREVAAGPEILWRLYCDTETWPSWNRTVAHLSLEGPFAPGTQGQLTPAGAADALVFRIVDCVAEQRYTSETDIASTITLRSTVNLRPVAPGRTEVAQRTDIFGDAADFFGPSFGPSLADGAAASLEALSRHAEAQQQAANSVADGATVRPGPGL